MAVAWALSGNVADTTAGFAVRADSGTVRVAVATSDNFVNAVYSSPVSPATGVAKPTITGLAANTGYFWAPEVNGVLDLDTIGHLVTNPTLGQPADITIRAFSCAGGDADYPGAVGGELAPHRISNSPGFSQVKAKTAHRTVHMGDWTYYNLGSDAFGIVGGGSIGNYRKMFDDVLRQPRQRDLYLDAPTVFLNDDHEGPNDHDRNYDGLGNLRQAFGERIPHTPLTVPGTLYREEVLGRTLLMYLDPRSARDPNNTPDGPGKSMLGPGQRHRIEQTLASSTAKTLIIFSPSVWWEPNRTDGWWGFRTEQQWLINLIHAKGWTGRVAVICGDVHALGLDTGTRSPGGIPTATFASIDSDFGVPLGHNDRGPTKPGRQQYGTIRVRDTGSRVDVTLTGYSGGAVWDSISFGFDVAEEPGPGPGPGPVLPPPPNPIPKPSIDWIACDLVSGDLITYLPAVTGTVSRALGAYTSDTLTLPIPRSGPGFLGPLIHQAIDIPTVMIAAIANNIPIWAGMLLKVAGGSDPTLGLGLTSLEAYFDHRFVADHAWAGRDEALIAAGLISDAKHEGLGFYLDAPATGTLRDRTYHDDEDATVYKRLQELMDVDGGPEWTVDLAWRSSKQQSIAKIVRVRKRIGLARPRVTISTRGKTAAAYTWSRDYSQGAGANDVRATSSGEGADRPQSQRFRHELALAAGVPRFEHRFQPSSSIKDENTLNQHAFAELARLAGGTTALEITARWNVEPARLGIDVNLGDQLEYDLVGPLHPTGLRGDGRMVGWRLDAKATTYQPVLRL